MEIEFDICKCEKYNLDIYTCYDLIDVFFMMQGVRIIGKGMYSGNSLYDKGFHAFATSICSLPKYEWFLSCITKWVWYGTESATDYLKIYQKRSNVYMYTNL